MTKLTGKRRLIRLGWRRDRVIISATLAVIWLTTFYSAVAMKDLYPTDADRIMANEQANAATGVVAMYGHIFDTSSVGGIASNKLAMINAFILAFLVIAIVRRHTRAEEESGRFELLGTAPVGRLAPLAAAVTVAAATSAVSGLVTIPAAIGGGWPVAGSVALGLAQTGVGLSFTAITAAAMQLSANTRTCSSWAYGALGAAFVLRMVGDVAWDQPARILSWLSPIGWGQQVRPYDGDRFWVLAIPIAFALAMTWVAVVLRSRRDLGAGLLPDRVGPAAGKLATPLQLAWRLQRGTFSGWLITYLLLGSIMGAMISTVGGLMSGPAEEMLRKMGAVGQFNDLYLTLVASMAALGAAAFGVATVMRLRSEESTGHLEQVLATPVRRLRFLASYLVIALVGSVVLMVMLGSALAGAHSRTAEATGFWREFSPALVSLPAIWVMIAVALLAAAWLPRFDWLGWAALAAVIVIGELGGLLGLPDWVQQISPFAHLPKLPVEAMAWAPVIAELTLAGVLVALAMVGYRRRDMPVA